MSLTDDPRFTAYAEGALPPRDSKRFARALAEDPEARAELEELRELQRGLRAAFAGVPPPSAERSASAAPAKLVRDGSSASVATRARSAAGVATPCVKRAGWMGSLFAAIGVMIVGATLLSTGGKLREASDRAMAAASLRQIGQAALIVAAGNGDRIPVALDVWDFARQLAREGGLDDATRWVIETDPAAKDDEDLSTVLGADRVRLHPEFAASKPAFAVVLSGVTTNSPPTTPIAWTRGLRADGTWGPESPFGAKGGHVVFLNGEVRFFSAGRMELIGRDGGLTRDIREALPVGSRIGEYVPTPAEARLWAEQERPLPKAARRAQLAQAGFCVTAAVVFAGACAWQLWRRRFRAGDLLMAALVATLLVLLGAAMH